MAKSSDVRHQILQKTLEEVSETAEIKNKNPCVICLESIGEVGVAIPCNHENFDFQCLITWLVNRPACPLCQAVVTGVKHHSHDGEVFWPLDNKSNISSLGAITNNIPNRSPSVDYPSLPDRQYEPTQLEAEVRRRRHIYRRQLYSLRMGSNRLSRYSEVTPRALDRDEQLVARARKWIRRELRVFTYLNTDVSRNRRNSGGTTRLRTNNAEFLLEYIIAIIRTVDIKGSGGQAQELLQEFFGAENSRLFLHELQSWLRSPYDSLRAWDNEVQYDE